MATDAGRDVRRPGAGWLVAGAVLLAVVLVFAVRRVLVDVPNVVDGVVPGRESPDRAYALHPLMAYLHIGFGVVYLATAPFQLYRPFRERHFTFHRRWGRVLVTLALVSGAAELAFGFRYAFGGGIETAAALVFGVWFLVAIVVAFAAIRRGDVVRHRRWMIRAFVVALGVGTIRVWIGVFTALGVFSLEQRFAIGFWLALTMHAAFAEWWVRRPAPEDAVEPSA